MTMKNEGQNDAAQHETVLAAPDVPAAADAIDLADRIVTKGFRRLSELGGPDAAQVLAYDMAHAAAGVATARALLDYGAKGDLEARITCAFTADMLHDLSSKVFGREEAWGIERDPLRRGALVRPSVPRPRLPRRARRAAGAPPSRQRDGAWSPTRSDRSPRT